MQDIFASPTIPASDSNPPPACPRRMLNEQNFLKRPEDRIEAPMTSARKIRRRFVNDRTILVNDAGLVEENNITGTTQ